MILNANAERSQSTLHFQIETIEGETLHGKFAIFNLCFQIFVVVFDSNGISIGIESKHTIIVNNAL